MNYTYKILIRESKFIIEELSLGEVIARHSLNKIIIIKDSPWGFWSEGALRTLKWLESNHPELLL